MYTLSKEIIERIGKFEYDEQSIQDGVFTYHSFASNRIIHIECGFDDLSQSWAEEDEDLKWSIRIELNDGTISTILFEEGRTKERFNKEDFWSPDFPVRVCTSLGYYPFEPIMEYMKTLQVNDGVSNLKKWFIAEISTEIKKMCVDNNNHYLSEKQPEKCMTLIQAFDTFRNTCIHHVMNSKPGSYYPAVWFEKRDCPYKLPAKIFDDMFRLVIDGTIRFDTVEGVK